MYTEQDFIDEYEQALKRRNKDYADGYVEGLKDCNEALNIADVSPRYFLVVSDYGDNERFIEVLSVQFPTFESANIWKNNKATRLNFPHAYIIGIY